MTQPRALVQMKCPGCGAALQIVQAMAYVVCSYCRTLVRTALRDELPSPPEDTATKARLAINRAATEQALGRLGKELEKLDIEYGALCSQKAPPPLSLSQTSGEPIYEYPKLLKQWLNEQDLLVVRMRTLQKCRATIMAEMAINKKNLEDM